MSREIPKFDARTGMDLNRLNAAKAQMEGAINAEIRATARQIFVELVLPALRANMQPPMIATEVKRCADLANKAAPYLLQAVGAVQIDEERHWGT